MRRILLTGATGFVGRHLYPALVACGDDVRCASRDAEAAARRWPDRTWVSLDLDDPATVARALDGCDATVYLVHRIATSADYAEREATTAEAFAAAAAQAGVERIVYLGGVRPGGSISRHLGSRLRTGEILRDGAVTAIELRAAMIIGPGSASWRIVRDLAARLPLMVLPRWLRQHSWPIAIDDVVAGLVAALEIDVRGSAWFDLPGPERLSHRQSLERAAALLGHHPRMVDIPLITPRLSSYWIGLVTSTDLSTARELVEGLRCNLDPTGPLLWDIVPHAPMSVDQAMRRALSQSADDSPDARASAAIARRALAVREALQQRSDQPRNRVTAGQHHPDPSGLIG